MSTSITSFVHRFIQAAVLGSLLLVPTLIQAQGDQVTMTTSSASGVGAEQIQTMTATVTAVDQATRTVSLKGENGEETTLTVSEEVKRLGEVKVGDQLMIGYLQSIGLEFREPTAEELKDPFLVVDETDRADKSKAPAGGKARTIRAVVTVEGASRWLNTLTVKGPRGNYLVVQVEPGMLKWEDLRIGQKMVGTYTEAMAMSLEPAPVKK